MLIIEDHTVIVKCRTVVKALFLYFNLCLSVKLDSLSCSLHQKSRQMLHQGIMSVSQESNIVRKQISPLHLNVLLLQQPIFLVRQSYVYSCLSEKVCETDMMP
jgi:hypothetical protein